MFRRTLRVHRKGFLWTTVLLCLMMAVAGLLNPLLALVEPILAEEEIVLPTRPDTLTLMMRCGLVYEFIGALYAASLGMRTLRRDAKPGALMWNLPVSRAQIVLRHYAAGALYVVLLAVMVGAVSFGVLTVSGLAGIGAIGPMMHPVIGFLAVYSLVFGLASIVNSGAMLGAAAMFVPVVLILPTCAMLLKAFSTLALPADLALFLPYGPTGALQIKTLVGAALAVLLPLLAAIGVTSRRAMI